MEGQKRQSTQLLLVLEEEVTSTIPVASGSTPIQERLELEYGCYCQFFCVFNECWNPTWYSWIAVLNGNMARDFEKFTDLVLTSNAFPGRPSRKSVQGLVKNLLGDVCTD